MIVRSKELGLWHFSLIQGPFGRLYEVEITAPTEALPPKPRNLHGLLSLSPAGWPL